MSLIELRNITFAYSEEDLVLEKFSLNIEAGTLSIIIGDNGCGKTTLLRILNGLSFPQTGDYYFDGQKIDSKYLKDNRNSKLFHKRIGYLFQNPDIMLFNSSVYDEIAFGPRQMGLSDDDVNTRVQDCMKLLDIEHLSQKAPYHLSGGQKKRVALAAVLALNPEVIVLDEPFASLDKKSQSWLISFLGDLKKAGKTILVALHEEGELQGLADNVYAINNNDPICD